MFASVTVVMFVLKRFILNMILVESILVYFEFESNELVDQLF